MRTSRRLLAGSVFAVIGFASPVIAWAGTPVQLTNTQLDRVTAGGASVFGSADAAATGVLTMATTETNSLVSTGLSPNPQQPAFASTGGAVDGTSLAVGTNLSTQSSTAPSTSTSVATGGSAQGNQVVTSTFNHTTHGAGGVTFQVGWTYVYGGWVGL